MNLENGIKTKSQAIIENHNLNKFSLDRTAFKIVSFEDKGDNVAYWLSKTPMERLEASWYLTCQAYNLPFSSDHKVDRTVFRVRKFDEE